MLIEKKIKISVLKPKEMHLGNQKFYLMEFRNKDFKKGNPLKPTSKPN